jgi:hypothetical protein
MLTALCLAVTQAATELRLLTTSELLTLLLVYTHCLLQLVAHTAPQS